MLHLQEGDLLEFSVDNHSISGHGLKLVPSKLFTEEIISELRNRERGMNRASETQHPSRQAHASVAVASGR